MKKINMVHYQFKFNKYFNCHITYLNWDGVNPKYNIIIKFTH